MVSVVLLHVLFSDVDRESINSDNSSNKKSEPSTACNLKMHASWKHDSDFLLYSFFTIDSLETYDHFSFHTSPNALQDNLYCCFDFFKFFLKLTMKKFFLKKLFIVLNEKSTSTTPSEKLSTRFVQTVNSRVIRIFVLIQIIFLHYTLVQADYKVFAMV